MLRVRHVRLVPSEASSRARPGCAESLGFNMVRYYGCLSGHSALRSEVVPKTPTPVANHCLTTKTKGSSGCRLVETMTTLGTRRAPPADTRLEPTAGRQTNAQKIRSDDFVRDGKRLAFLCAVAPPSIPPLPRGETRIPSPSRPPPSQQLPGEGFRREGRRRVRINRSRPWGSLPPTR